MKKPEFEKPPKIKGHALVPLNAEVEDIAKIAIKEFADEQSVAAGMKVSIGNVVWEAMKIRWPQVRDRYKQLEKEKRHAKKHLDGIKSR